MNEEKKYTLKREELGGVFVDYVDQDGVSFDSPANWLFTGILGGCGCGSSDDFAEKAVKVLSFFALSHEERKGYLRDENELMAHWLDSKGLLEHGSSIGGSWLSQKGTEVHQAIKNYPPKPLP